MHESGSRSFADLVAMTRAVIEAFDQVERRPWGIGELADILYCLIRIADHYEIDVEAAHVAARRPEVLYLGRDPGF